MTTTFALIAFMTPSIHNSVFALCAHREYRSFVAIVAIQGLSHFFSATKKHLKLIKRKPRLELDSNHGQGTLGYSSITIGTCGGLAELSCQSGTFSLDMPREAIETPS